ALRCDVPLTWLIEVTQQLAALGVEDLGADRHARDQALAALAVLILAAAVLAAARLEHAPVLQIEQGGQARIGLEHHVAAVAAVAAGRPPERPVLLAPHRRRSVATVAGLELDRDLVDEM